MRRRLALEKGHRRVRTHSQATKRTHATHKHTTRHSRQRTHHPVRLPVQPHLTPQPVCVRQPERHRSRRPWLREPVLVLRREDDVEGQAGDGAVARAFEVNAVLAHEGEDPVVVSFDVFYLESTKWILILCQ